MGGVEKKNSGFLVAKSREKNFKKKNHQILYLVANT
jgi:hypothetical protein